MHSVQGLVRIIFLLNAFLLLAACGSYAHVEVYVQNDSSEQVMVVYKRSNSGDFYKEEALSLEVEKREELFAFEAGGETLTEEECEPFLVEYLMIKGNQGQILYTQDPTDPALWDCSLSKQGSLCTCLFVITEDVLTPSDDQPDADNVGE
ncbi:MAG TPA: hypothetical protein P5077_07145 [bacterium]|nr:hypothetical protein [bacterium]